MEAWLAISLSAEALLLLGLETLRPLRQTRELKSVRLARNLTLAGIGFVVFVALQAPLVVPVSSWATKHGLGLLRQLPVPRPFRIAAAFLLLDYTLWVWHWLNHRAPFFWRFHRVHHVDRDMDASTGLRFHAGELVLSTGYRMLQIVAIGAEPVALGVWQTVLVASVLFHHSNARLPVALERALVRLIVTPRMHGIHHSDYRRETDSNWSSILSVWDYLHGTARLDVSQDAVSIGVAAYQDPRDVTLPKILALPWRGKPDDWARAEGSAARARAQFDANRHRLHE